jgi:hypothetical protein
MYRLVKVVWCVDALNEDKEKVFDLPVFHPVFVWEETLRDWIEEDYVADGLSDHTEWLVHNYEITDYRRSYENGPLEDEHNEIYDGALRVIEQTKEMLEARYLNDPERAEKKVRARDIEDYYSMPVNQSCVGYKIDPAIIETCDVEEETMNATVSIDRLLNLHVGNSYCRAIFRKKCKDKGIDWRSF